MDVTLERLQPLSCDVAVLSLRPTTRQPKRCECPGPPAGWDDVPDTLPPRFHLLGWSLLRAWLGPSVPARTRRPAERAPHWASTAEPQLGRTSGVRCCVPPLESNHCMRGIKPPNTPHHPLKGRGGPMIPRMVGPPSVAGDLHVRTGPRPIRRLGLSPSPKGVEAGAAWSLP